MKFLSNRKTGVIYALGSGICYSLIGYFGITLIKGGSSVYNMLFWRFLISIACTLIMLVPQYKTLIFLTKDNFKIMLSGIFFYSTSSIIFFISGVYIGTGLAMIIFFIYPAFIMIINIFLYNAPFSKTYFIAFLIIIIGLVFLVDIQNAAFNILGVVVGVIAAILYAWYIIVSQQVVINPLLATLFVSIGCAITCFIFALIDSSLMMPKDFKNWLDVLAIGLICTTLPILLLLIAMKYIDAEKAAILSVLEPVFALMVGVTLLDEKVTGTQIIGIMIVLGGSIMILLHNVPKKANVDSNIHVVPKI